MCAKEGLGSPTTYKEKQECQNWSKTASNWEKVTHLTVMLGGGLYSEGSDSVLENMMPFDDITLQNLASLSVFLCGRCSGVLGSNQQTYNDWT